VKNGTKETDQELNDLVNHDQIVSIIERSNHNVKSPMQLISLFEMPKSV